MTKQDTRNYVEGTHMEPSVATVHPPACMIRIVPHFGLSSVL